MLMCRGFLLLIVLPLPMLAAASAAEAFGDISGQFVVEGPVGPQPLLIKGGGPLGMLNVPDESLVIDKKTKGLANVFVYLRKAPAEGYSPLGADRGRES